MQAVARAYVGSLQWGGGGGVLLGAGRDAAPAPKKSLEEGGGGNPTLFPFLKKVVSSFHTRGIGVSSHSISDHSNEQARKEELKGDV